MMTKLVLPALLLIAIGVPLQVQAQPPSSPDSAFLYYEIGGGQSFSRPPNPLVNSATFAASAELGLNYSCGAFDPVMTIANQLNQLRDAADAFAQQMYTAATTAVAMLPAYILQRANPGLYDLFTTAQLRAEETLRLHTKSCEQMESEMAQGMDPFHEWVMLSKGHDWRATMGTAGVSVDSGDQDIAEASKKVAENAGGNGVPWVGGRAGGVGQPPIRVVTDTIKAGYNITADRAPFADGTAFGSDDPNAPPMVRYWNSPADAGKWAVEVLGDVEVVTCHKDGCPPAQSTPGMGMTRMVEKDRDALLPLLVDMVDGTSELNMANLQAVSATGVQMTPDLLRSIRELPPAEQRIATGRLADEIATAINVEKALYLRRFFLTGRMMPEIQAAGPASRPISEKVAELEREIDNTLFESRVRKELVSGTSSALLRHSEIREASSLSVGPTARKDPRPLEGGAVLDEEE